MNSYRKSSNFPCSVRCARSFSGRSLCIKIEQLNLFFSTGASRTKVINVNGANASCIGNATISLHVHVKRRNMLMSAILDSFSPIYLSFLQLNINVAHHFEQQPFTLKPFFCDHCGSFIRPGHAHKCSREIMIELTWHILTIVCCSLRLRDDRSSSLYGKCRQLLWMWKERLSFVRWVESEGQFSERWQLLIQCFSLTSACIRTRFQLSIQRGLVRDLFGSRQPRKTAESLWRHRTGLENLSAQYHPGFELQSISARPCPRSRNEWIGQWISCFLCDRQ